MSKHKSRNRSPGKATGIKSSAVELAARVDAVAKMLARGCRKTEIVQAMHRRHGTCARTAENYLARARAEILARLGRSREEFRAESLAFYEAKQSDPRATVGEQLRARQRIDELLGLDAPRQVRTQVSGPEGGKVTIECKEKEPFDFAGYQKVCEQFLFGTPMQTSDLTPQPSPAPSPCPSGASTAPGGRNGNGHPG